ncbi:hypothetical protein [Streptomyces tsukubensis]|uniref:hypothetical protein n=1 Tax=Streptomyces tsukubensis TaxID=83656 RepID=UPI00344CBB1A
MDHPETVTHQGILDIEGRGPAWESCPHSCSELLGGLLTGETRSFYFDEFPLPDHTFDPNSDIL